MSLLFILATYCFSNRYLLIVCSESDEVCFLNLDDPKTDMEKIKVGTRPRNIVVNHNEGLAFVSNSYDGTVGVLDLKEKKVKETITVGSFPWGIKQSPDGKKLFVCNLGDNTLSVIDTGTLKVIATVSVGSMPWSVKISPCQQEALVTCFKDSTVHVLNIESGRVTQVVKVGKSPRSIKLDPTGKKAYVLNFNSHDMSVLTLDPDLKWKCHEKSLLLGRHPMGMMITQDGKTAYVTHRGPDGVWAIDLESMEVIKKKIFHDDHFSGIAYDGTEKLLYLSRMSENSITMIDTKTMEIIGRLDIEYGPKGLAYYDENQLAQQKSSLTVTQALRSLRAQ